MQADDTARTFPVEIAVPNPGYVEVDGEMIPRRVAEGRGELDHQSSANGPSEAGAATEATLLAGGMFARATLQAGPSAMTTAVPKDAVTMRDGVEFVCMVAPGQQEGSLVAIPMPVTTGVDVDEWIAVTSGNLAPGMQVVTNGNENILLPSPIEIVKPPGQIAEAAPTPPAPAPSSKIGS
jgi:hypothetical protein